LLTDDSLEELRIYYTVTVQVEAFLQLFDVVRGHVTEMTFISLEVNVEDSLQGLLKDLNVLLVHLLESPL
jgi:hypothetical protein